MSHLEGSSSTEEGRSLSRRDALKALAAIGGAATLSVLPNEWEPPVVKVGTLPAFAQASPSPVTISNLSASDRRGPCDPGGGQASDLFSLSLTYNDTQGQVFVDQTRLRAILEFLPSQATESNEVTLNPINISGDGSSGTITIPLCVGFGSEASVNVTIFIRNARGSESNSQTVNITNPGSSPREPDSAPGGSIVAS